MNILDGKKMSQTILADLKERVAKLDFVPVFVDVLVGDDPVSLQYIQMKEKRARDIGVAVHRVSVSGDATTEEVITEMQKALENQDVCGAIVQLPLPQHVDTAAVLDAVPSHIDVDLLGKESGENFYNNTAVMAFPAANAAFMLLQTVEHEPSDSTALVVGQGVLVGKPVTHMLREAGYTVETASRSNPVTAEMLERADIIISATGVPNIITAENLKSGVIVIDAGTSESDGGIIGDVDSASVADKAAYLAPVPGGVGPMTVALLLENVVRIAESR